MLAHKQLIENNSNAPYYTLFELITFMLESLLSKINSGARYLNWLNYIGYSMYFKRFFSNKIQSKLLILLLLKSMCSYNSNCQKSKHFSKRIIEVLSRIESLVIDVNLNLLSALNWKSNKFKINIQ